MVHVPVLLQSALHYLNIKPGHKYIDATLGGGGHARAIINLGGQVLGLDQDIQALSACPDLEGLIKVHSNFTHLAEIAKKHSWRPVSGILYDLGVSSFQLDTPNRGFSLQSSGPVDMRMDNNLPTSAADIVNTFPVDQLTHILTVFGEVAQAKILAQKIVSARPITDTLYLAKLMGKSARQVFQALRIAVNDELGALQTGLPQALDLLEPGGRIVVISFHSLEDRIVKQTFASWPGQSLGPIVPDQSELLANPKSHSAKLRIFQKI